MVAVVELLFYNTSHIMVIMFNNLANTHCFECKVEFQRIYFVVFVQVDAENTICLSFQDCKIDPLDKNHLNILYFHYENLRSIIIIVYKNSFTI